MKTSQSFSYFSYYVLKTSWLFISVAMLTSAFCTYLVSKNIPKEYLAKATLIFMSQGNTLSLPIGNISLPQGGRGLDGNTIKQILKSRTLMETVVKKMNLDKYFKRSVLDSIQKLRSRTRIRYSEFKRILFIRVRLQSPELAADTVNSFIESLEELNEKLRLSTEKELVTVLDPAIPPLYPSGPSVKKNIISALASSCFISYILAFFWLFLWKKKIKD